MRNRVVIEHVRPEVNGGRFFIKRIVGEDIKVSAHIFSDGHDYIRAALLYKNEKEKRWSEVPMQDHVNDEWSGSFTVKKRGFYHYKIEGWVDHLYNWYKGFLKKEAAGQQMQVELLIGANLLKSTAANYSKAKAAPLLKLAKLFEKEEAYQEAVGQVLSPGFKQLVEDHPFKQFQTIYDNNLRVRVGREKELFSSWYEFFPRSTAKTPGEHGTFKDCHRILPRIKEMGFDVLYFPPIHPVGQINRKGKNNVVNAQADDPGSPWAIGSKEGGHKAINPDLGTLEDFKSLIAAAKKQGIEIAMDIAFQCAPDHPYIKKHPDWFIWRPDGTIMYAENPPKKYQDIVPINFETTDWENLWEELKSIFLYWMEQGISIFRIDNPHTKPFRFWEWVITEVQKVNPDAIFLSEAFTRPKIMAQLAKGGFTQSYSYFTWRTTKVELEEYMNELTQTESREYFRPNFWPNTPDILAYELMGANTNAFVKRFILAATLSSNYGMYGPAYEFMENTGSDSGKEEYLNSEKYEIRHYDWEHRNRLTEVITKVNQIRKTHPALQSTWNLNFTRTDNDQISSYIKLTPDHGDIIWCVVNFDAHHVQSGYIEVPKKLLNIDGNIKIKVTDLLTGEVYHWFNDWNFVELDPEKFPAHIFKVEIEKLT